MVEGSGAGGDSSGVPTIAELLTSYRDRTGSPSYDVMARKVRNEIASSRLHQLHTQAPRNFPDPRTIEVLAELLEVSVTTIVLSCAASLGIRVRDSLPLLALSLPPGTDNLTDEDRDSILAVTRQLVSARRPVPPGEGEPPEPDLSKVQGMRLSEESQPLRVVDDDRRYQ